MNTEVPIQEFEFTFARSSGAGGQNVNKVNSKAILRWQISASTALSPEVKHRFLAKYASRITAEGDVIVTSQKYRDQYKNVQDCIEKLSKMIEQVSKPPVPRKPTKPSRAAKQRRLSEKREHSVKKQCRQRTNSMDE